MENGTGIEILDKIKGKLAEDEFASLQALLNKQVVALGTDRAFALRDSKGEIVAFKQRVRLCGTDGTLVKVKDNWSISAQGYEALAEASGTSVMTPKYLFVDGSKRSNPWVQRDEHHRVVTVYARAIAFRFNSKGLPIVSDWLTTYDSPNYRLIDLLAKAKGTPKVFRLLPKGMQPEIEYTQAGVPITRTWAQYYFDPACDLWVDTAAPEVLDWHSSIINREKKSLDIAQTFSRRNAVKHLLGLQKAPEGSKGVWDVTVLCWRPVEGSILKWDLTRYVEMRNRVEHLSSGGSFELAEVSRGVEEITPGDDSEVIDLEAEPDTTEPAAPAENGGPAETRGEAAPPPSAAGAAPEKQRKTKPKPEGSVEAQAKAKNLLGFRSFYRAEYEAGLQALGLPPDYVPDVHDEATIDKLMAAISRALDAAVGGDK